jgi:hypothetical protein
MTAAVLGRVARRGSWLAAALLVPGLAFATLGEPLAAAQTGSQRLGVARAASFDASTQVHTATYADGSTIRQYVGADGRVYAVAWNSRAKPRLDDLLGAHFPTYAEAGRGAMQQRAGVMHHAVVQKGDLVVESSAHLNAHVGRAYLRSRLPAGTPLDALR